MLSVIKQPIKAYILYCLFFQGRCGRKVALLNDGVSFKCLYNSKSVSNVMLIALLKLLQNVSLTSLAAFLAGGERRYYPGYEVAFLAAPTPFLLNIFDLI